ncbi:MAG: CHC2 zinc finger domain-containing protein [Stenotrophomonas sepilia]|jgi:DNA primase
MASSCVDTDAVRESANIADVIGRYVKLRPAGRGEYSGLCPFHDESSPSFTVNEVKGFYHCFGCGAHDDVIGFLVHYLQIGFLEACAQLNGGQLGVATEREKLPSQESLRVKWVPILPVPDDAPALLTDSGWTVPIWNAKRDKLRRMKPARVFPYRNAEGKILGYVLRCEFIEHDSRKLKKWTPQVTWCVGPAGQKQWCLESFPGARPLYGLDALGAKPDAPVLIPEGEKCRDVAARAFPGYAAISWAGGGKAVTKADWSPLAGRDCVLWPDADVPGQQAMLGWRNDANQFKPGVAQLLKRAGARSIRFVDVTGQPDGWDIADALERDGWTPRQLAAWAANRVVEVDVVAANGA